MLTRLLRAFARLYPRQVDPGDDVDRALGFLEAEVTAATVVRAGCGAGLACAAVAPVAVLVAPPGFRMPAGLAVVAVAFAVTHAVHAGPGLLATARRTSALGEAPGVISRAVLRMRITPTVETAATFAARTGDGVLADSLGDHVRRARGTPGSGLSAFADEWGDRFPALRRGVLLIESAGSAPPDERARALDRAVEATLDGTRERMEAFANEIRGPTTALYAFGVLLPLSLLSILPAAGAVGLTASVPVLVVVYDAVLPAGLVAAGAWLLARRPVAFPPPTLSAEHPALDDSRVRAIAASLCVALIGWGVATALLPGWTRVLAAVGPGIGTALVVRYRRVMTVRDRIDDLESGLADALYLVGRRIEEGLAVESALDRATAELTGETRAVFAAATRRQRQLRVGVDGAFRGEHGPLVELPSPRAESTVALLALSAREGRPAGSAVVAMADHLEQLRTVEREARRELESVTATLGHTGAVFAPLVAGATVAMADALSGGLLGSGGGPETAALGLAAGAYVLFLAVALTALAAGLSRGFDRALIGYRTGIALLIAVPTYLVAFAATTRLV